MTMQVTMEVAMKMGTFRVLEKPSFCAKSRQVPGKTVIESLLMAAETPFQVILHQRRVAEVVLKIGELCTWHIPVDLELLVAAAQLHDILRTQPDHARKGAAFLTRNGFPDVAKVVEGHMDLPSQASMETKILYLADKYVNGMEIVSLREREELVRQSFPSGGKALENALRRIKMAFEIERLVEKITGEYCGPAFKIG
ncbi:MAG: HD domain-containing protein [Synergistaceae bacterium]|jgi:HD superfamily phosphohydrolase YqeK|nr:HD domain-containing protein [Synergistaceae bacterium]